MPAYYGLSPLRGLKVLWVASFFQNMENTRKIGRNKYNGRFMFSAQNT